MPVVVYPEATIVFPSQNVVWGKRILLDIDGVICEYQFDKIVKDFFGVDLDPREIFAYDLADVLGVSTEEIHTMFMEQLYGKPNFIEGALDTLKLWKSRGNEILILSNRVKYMGEYDLARWLIDNQIPFDDISNGNGRYDIHIDDKPSKLADTYSKVKLLYTHPWNEQCKDIKHQLTRVSSWDEIKNIVG